MSDPPSGQVGVGGRQRRRSKLAPGGGGGGWCWNKRPADLRVCIVFQLFQVIYNFFTRVRVGKLV